MNALALATALHARRASFVGWAIFVADDADLDSGDKSVEAFRIKSLKLKKRDKEINLIVEYPEEENGETTAMSAEQFLDSLEPLASDNPDFAVEASVRIDIVIDGERWDQFHMPVRSIHGYEGARAVILGVEGLHEIPGRAGS